MEQLLHPCRAEMIEAAKRLKAQKRQVETPISASADPRTLLETWLRTKKHR